ncbi:hypothetical protein [Ferrimonas marina]|uniref:Uncharacterized protein n=1 Tax=Ferrimonas marina TaxID=299255 RepID=A0A1M5ZBB9_9GAMM|nr:hypothetical protein [Ferrimonas marina]SHI21514.1 hypothetical protein SAMN02745129_0147 [Ferrimonas marina]
MAISPTCPAARLHFWARPLVIVLCCTSAWFQVIPLMVLGLLAWCGLTWHLFHTEQTQSAQLQTERAMVELQSGLERVATALFGVLAVTLILHLLWMHQLRLALILMTTAACVKVVWNVIHLGRPGVPASLAIMLSAGSLYWVALV